MSADKHKGVARRKFAAANLVQARLTGKHDTVTIVDDTPADAADVLARRKAELTSHRVRQYNGYAVVDITKDVQALVRIGSVVRTRAEVRNHHNTITGFSVRQGLQDVQKEYPYRKRKQAKVSCSSTRVLAYTP